MKKETFEDIISANVNERARIRKLQKEIMTFHTSPTLEEVFLSGLKKKKPMRNDDIPIGRPFKGDW